MYEVGVEKNNQEFRPKGKSNGCPFDQILRRGSGWELFSNFFP